MREQSGPFHRALETGMERVAIATTTHAEDVARNGFCQEPEQGIRMPEHSGSRRAAEALVGLDEITS